MKYLTQITKLETVIVGGENPIHDPLDIANLCAFLGESNQEHFLVVSLLLRQDGRRHAAYIDTVHIGLDAVCQCSPKNVLRYALSRNAESLILVHNHPSGNLDPSQADKLLTTRFKEACKVIDMPMLDHVIVGKEGKYFSFQEGGLL